MLSDNLLTSEGFGKQSTTITYSSDLHAAVKAGDQSGVRELLGYPEVSVNAKDVVGRQGTCR